MKKYIYNEAGIKLIRIEEAQPKCCKNFCDSCGDCLHCYGGDKCVENEDGQHFWVQYGESIS